MVAASAVAEEMEREVVVDRRRERRVKLARIGFGSGLGCWEMMWRGIGGGEVIEQPMRRVRWRKGAW